MIAILASMILAAAAPPQPRAADGQCHAGVANEIAVRITGFRSRAGQVRVRLFGGATSTYFDKKQALVRIERPVPASGAVTICVVAPKPGLYAVDVRHDENGDGKTDKSDGGGTSGNPRISLFDMLLSRKPDPAKVQFPVGAGTTIVPVTLMYLDGGTFKPIRASD
ncbi:DUF2141 domain-containing protein [Sphingomonas sp. GB1N7]|uniref:DUF2141 domain-containing protein n=1 Tax=Parasphingomonas caseinilytica TaxID=3096158 RepID=UPI002FC70836